MKKTYIIFACIMVMVFSCFYVFAENDAAVIEFAVSEADSNGYFDVTVKVYDMNFSGIQAALEFNPNAAQVVSIADGTATSNFDEAREVLLPGNIISELWKNVDNTNGTFRFANYLSTSAVSPLINGDNLIVAGKDGLEIYKIRFKKISDEDFTLALSTAEASLPSGIIVANDVGELFITARFTFPKQPVTEVKSGGGGGGKGSSQEPPPEIEPEISERDKRIGNTAILQIDNYAVVIDGVLSYVDEDTQIQPYIKNDRTMVPLRLIAEAFGNEVDWLPETQGVVIKGEDIEILLNIGSNIVHVNGTEQLIEAEPEIVISRTFVPLRFIAEILGKDVTWNEENRTVIICPAEFPWRAEHEVEKAYMTDALTIMSPLVRDFYDEGGSKND